MPWSPSRIMPTTDSERLVRLEARSDYHERELVELRGMISETSKLLKGMDTRLKQIFWLGAGASAVLAAQNFELAGVLAKMLAP